MQIKKTFLNFIDEISEKSQKHAAWFAMVMVTLYPYLTKQTFLKQLSLGVICSIALAQLNSIKRSLSSSGKIIIFQNTEEAYVEVDKLLKKRLKTKKTTKVQNIGVSFYYTFDKFCHMFNDFHTENGKYPNMEVTFKVPRPDAEFWKGVEEQKWRIRNIGFYHHFIEQGKKFLENNCTPENYFKLEVYNYPPNVSGFYIDGKSLFVSSCLFKSGYEVHRNQYVKFQKGDSVYSDGRVSDFEDWCSHNSEQIPYKDIRSLVKNHRF